MVKLDLNYGTFQLSFKNETNFFGDPFGWFRWCRWYGGSERKRKRGEEMGLIKSDY